jgi:cytochrome c oxidase assembly protein subunit 15
VRRFAQFAWAVLGFNLLVILWGALVRASRSGEGCGDHWPLCNGTVIPHAQQIATVIEFTHRVTTGIAFLSVVAMTVWAFRAYRKDPVWPAAAASLILIITEALLGAGLVLFKFVGADVSAGRVVYLSAHLINTLLMLAAMALTAWWASGHRAIEWPGATGKAPGGAILGIVAIAVTGAITALSDTLFPVNSLLAGIQADFEAASPVLVKLRILHPLVALAAGAYIAIAISRIDRAPLLRRTTIALVGIEIAAGMLNLLLLAPIWMQLVHLLIADLLWIVLVLFTAAVLEKSPVRSAQPELAGLSRNAG